MNIYQAQKFAKDNDQYNTGRFVALFPAGPKQCKWLDAYFGFFTIDGIEGFLTVDDVDSNFPNLIVQPIDDDGDKA